MYPLGAETLSAAAFPGKRLSALHPRVHRRPARIRHFFRSAANWTRSCIVSI